ncbi:hypothetical protein ACFV6F_18150, partial [Kitasatospora phosalacinea]
PPGGAGARGGGGWTREVATLGTMALCCLVAQGAVQDWGAVFLREQRGAAPGAATLGYVVFSVFLVLVRLVGDRLAARFGAVLLLRAFVGLAVAGMLLVVLVPAAAAGVLGFALVGAGLSVLDPLVSSAAGRLGGGDPGTTARGVAHVATLGHLGLLLGPPAIGWLSELLGLGPAMAAAVLLMVPGVALAAGPVRVWNTVPARAPVQPVPAAAPSGGDSARSTRPAAAPV